MTPLQFAREECANHQPDGSCLGVVIAPDLSLHLGTPRDRCRLRGKDRCAYFEKCVAPMADMATDTVRATALQTALAEYRLRTKQGEDLTRQCPECEGPMAKGKRFCPKCAARRRKETHRRHNARRGDSGVADTTVNEKDTPNSLGNAGSFSGSRPNAIQDSHHPKNGPLTVVASLAR